MSLVLVRLVRPAVLACVSIFFISCMAEKRELRHSPIRTYLQVELSPEETFQKAAGFLEFIKGWGIDFKSEEKGLIITEWSREAPNERYRWTLRVSEDPKGTIMTAYVSYERLNPQRQTWEGIPSDGVQENRLLSEFEATLKKNSSTIRNK